MMSINMVFKGETRTHRSTVLPLSTGVQTCES